MEVNKIEADVLNALAKAWNGFCLLDSMHPDDLPDFRRSIHECQRIIAMRQLRRIDSTYITITEMESDD